jgi:5-methylcytosine-specific restriction protein A
MPQRPLRPCTTPGCPGRTPDGRCPACRDTRQTNPRLRAEKTAERGYDAPWRRRRLDYLTDHPVCALCHRAATIADHHPISRRDLVARGDPDPDAPHHLRPLCRTCHDRATGRHQPGGWRRETLP